MSFDFEMWTTYVSQNALKHAHAQGRETKQTNKQTKEVCERRKRQNTEDSVQPNKKGRN